MQNSTIEVANPSDQDLPLVNKLSNVFAKRSPSIDQINERLKNRKDNFKSKIEERSTIIKDTLLQAPGGQLHRGSMIFTRQDVVILKSWMTEQLFKIEQEPISQEEKTELTMCIFNIAMEEITKHLFVQCREQGNLVEYIWLEMQSKWQQNEAKNQRSTTFLLEFEQNKNKQLKDQAILDQNNILALNYELSLYYKNDEYNLNSKIFDKNKLSKENTTDNEMNQKAHTSKEDQEDEEILLNGIRSRFARLEERAKIEKVQVIEDSSDSEMDKDIKRLDKIAPELMHNYKQENNLSAEAIAEEKAIIDKINKIQNTQFNSKKTDTNDLYTKENIMIFYSQKLQFADLKEAAVDSKQQEIDLSMLNDQNLSDCPSNDLESEAPEIIEQSKECVDQAEPTINKDLDVVINRYNPSENYSQKLLPIPEEYKVNDECNSETASVMLDEDHCCRGIQTDTPINNIDFINTESNISAMMEELNIDSSINEENNMLFQQLLSFKDNNISFKLDSLDQMEEYQLADMESADHKTKCAIYKRQLLKAIKLTESLKKEIEQYKKMGKIVHLMSGNRVTTDELKDELTDDLKLVIADLKEHIEMKECEEMDFVRENLKKLLRIIDPKHAKEIEEILEKVSNSKASK